MTVDTALISVPTASSASIPFPREYTFDAAEFQILARHWYSIALTREVGDNPVPMRL